MSATAQQVDGAAVIESPDSASAAVESGVGKLRATSQLPHPIAICALVAIGATLRALCCVDYPFVHADEYHQYLNPALWRLSGSGVEAWEWRDGARSWVFPFYHGAWMSLLMQLGLESGAALTWFFRAHWALVNSSIAYVAWCGAAALTRQLNMSRSLPDADPEAEALAGWTAAGMCVLFAPLLVYGAHTLTELPSMLLLVWGLVSTHTLVHRTPVHRERSRAIVTGIALSLSACLRIANGPLVLIVPLWLLCARRHRALASLVAAALLPALIFALVDWATWGSLASSFIFYVKFNLIEGRAALFGTQPPGWYAQLLWSRAPWTLPVLVALGGLGLRATWPFMLSAVFALGYLSTQAHKEERFILMVWPLLLIAAAAALGPLLSRLRARAKRRGRSLAIATALAFTSAVALDAWVHREGPDLEARAIMACERWAGDQRDLRGLVLLSPWWHGGGALWYGYRVPTVADRSEALFNPLFNYVILRANSNLERISTRAGYRTLYNAGDYRVRKRD